MKNSCRLKVGKLNGNNRGIPAGLYFQLSNFLTFNFALALAIAITIASVADAIEIAVRTKLSPAEATVGDRVTLEITFLALPAIKFEHVMSSTTFGDWDIANISNRPGQISDDGSAETIFSIVLIPWSATLTGTPPFNFNAIQPPGRVEAISVKPVPIKMESVLAREEDPSDLKPIKGAIGYRSWWPWIVGVGAIALALVAWWLWRRRKRVAAATRAPLVPAVPPEITARESMDELAASGLLEAGDIKLFYSRLSDIFRHYVEGRFQVPALDRTTTELLPELRARDQLRPLYSEIRLLLESCDLVKFAKYVPDSPDIESDIARVRRFVDDTSPRSEPAPPGTQARDESV